MEQGLGQCRIKLGASHLVATLASTTHFIAGRGSREAGLQKVFAGAPRSVHGAVCFAGTRIPVTVVLDNLADGAAPAEILRQYPGLRAEHVPAALGYAAELARERVVSIPA